MFAVVAPLLLIEYETQSYSGIPMLDNVMRSSFAKMKSRSLIKPSVCSFDTLARFEGTPIQMSLRLGLNMSSRKMSVKCGSQVVKIYNVR